MPVIARPLTSSRMGLPADDFPVSPSTNVDSQQTHASPYQEIHSQRDKRASPPASAASGTAALSARFKAMDYQPAGASPLATTSTSAYQDEEQRSHHLHPDSNFASSSLSPLMSGGSPSFSQQGRMRRQQLDPRRPSIQADQRLASKASWSRKTSDLPSVSVPLGRSAEGGYSRTVSGQSRGTGRGPASSRHFLTVVPPEDFPADRPNARSAAASSSYSNLRRGALLPLYPTLNGQLYAISREYGLPSIGGLSIYLCEDGDGNLGPRIGEGTWEVLWSRYFLEDDEDNTSGPHGRILTPHSPFMRYVASRDRDASPSRFPDALSPEDGATGSQQSPDLRGSGGRLRNVSDGVRRATGGSNSWRSGSPQPFSHDPETSFATVSSTSRLAAALPIVGRVEWTVDKHRALWWASWAGEASEQQPSAAPTATSSRRQKSLQLSKLLENPDVSITTGDTSTTSINDNQEDESQRSAREATNVTSQSPPAPPAVTHQRQLSSTSQQRGQDASSTNMQAPSSSTQRMALQRSSSDVTVAPAHSSPLVMEDIAEEGAVDRDVPAPSQQDSQSPDVPNTVSQPPSYHGYSALMDDDTSEKTSTEDEDTRGSSSVEGTAARLRRRTEEADPTRSLPPAPHTRRMTFEVITDSDESMWRSLQDAPHPPATIGLSQKILTSYESGEFGAFDATLLQMPRHPSLSSGSGSVSQWIVATQSSPDLLKRRSDFIQECVVEDSVQGEDETTAASEAGPLEDDVKEVMELWAEKAPAPVFRNEGITVDGLGITQAEPSPPQDPSSLSAVETKLKLLSPIALDDVGAFQGAPPQLGDLASPTPPPPQVATPPQDQTVSRSHNPNGLRFAATPGKVDKEADPAEDALGSSGSSDSSGLEDFERALQLLSPVASAQTHSPSLAQLALFEDGHKMSSRDSLAAARTLSTSVTPSPRWLSRKRTPGSQVFDFTGRRFSAGGPDDHRQSRGSASLATISASSSRLAEQISSLDERRTASAGDALRSTQSSRQRLASAPSVIGSQDRQSMASEKSFTSSMFLFHPGAEVPIAIKEQRHDRGQDEARNVESRDTRESMVPSARSVSVDSSIQPEDDVISERGSDEATDIDARSVRATDIDAESQHSEPRLEASAPSVVRRTSPSPPPAMETLPEEHDASEEPELDVPAAEEVLTLPAPGNNIRADSADTVVPPADEAEPEQVASEEVEAEEEEALPLAGEMASDGMASATPVDEPAMEETRQAEPAPHSPTTTVDASPQSPKMSARQSLPIENFDAFLSPKTPLRSSPTSSRAFSSFVDAPDAEGASFVPNEAFAGHMLPQETDRNTLSPSAIDGTRSPSPSPSATDGEDVPPSVARMIRAESFGASSAATDNSLVNTPSGRSDSEDANGKAQDVEASLHAMASSPSFEETLSRAATFRETYQDEEVEELKAQVDIATDEQGPHSLLSSSAMPMSASVDSCYSTTSYNGGHSRHGDSTIHHGSYDDDTVQGVDSPDSWGQEDGQRSGDSDSRFGGDSGVMSTVDTAFTQLDGPSPETPTFFFERHLRDGEAGDSRPSSFRGSNYSALSGIKLGAMDGLPQEGDGLRLGLAPSVSANSLRQGSSLARDPLGGEGGQEYQVQVEDTSEDDKQDTHPDNVKIETAMKDEKEAVAPSAALPTLSQQYRHSTADVTKDLEEMLSSIETFASSSDHVGRRWSRPGTTAAKPTSPFDIDEDSSLANSRSTTLPNLAYQQQQQKLSTTESDAQAALYAPTARYHMDGTADDLGLEEEEGEDAEDNEDADHSHDIEAMTRTTRQAVRQALGRSDPSLVTEVVPFRTLSASPDHQHSYSEMRASGSGSSGSFFAGGTMGSRSRSRSPHRRPSLEPPKRSFSAGGGIGVNGSRPGSSSSGGGMYGGGVPLGGHHSSSGDSYYTSTRPSLMSPGGRRFRTLPPSPSLLSEAFLREGAMSRGSEGRGGTGSGSEINGDAGATTAPAPAAGTDANIDGQEENETRSIASSATSTSTSASGSAPGAGAAAGKVTPKPLLVESSRMLNQAELPAHGGGYKTEYEGGMAMSKAGALGLALATRQEEGHEAEQRQTDTPVVFHDSPVAQSEVGAYSP